MCGCVRLISFCIFRFFDMRLISGCWSCWFPFVSWVQVLIVALFDLCWRQLTFDVGTNTLRVFLRGRFFSNWLAHIACLKPTPLLCVCVACFVCSVPSRVGINLLYKSPGRTPGWRFTARCKYRRAKYVASEAGTMWLVTLMLLLLWVILLSDGAHLSWWCHIWYGGNFWKRRFFYVKNLKKIDGYKFTIHTTCIPWCMQKLRSVHIPSNKLEWRQGLHGWTRGTSHVLNNHENMSFPGR